MDFGLDYDRPMPIKCKRINYKDPFELLGLINNAEMVFTTSFHGAAMSILLNKQFYVFLPFLRKDRLNDLMMKFNISSHIYKDEKSFMEEIIDYQSVNKLLEKYRMDTIEIMDCILKEGDR